jgi:hypothetical protein
MNSPSQQALTEQQSFAAWGQFLHQQQGQAEEEARAQQARLRYLEASGLPSPALQEALNSLTQALQNAANAALTAGDLPAYWRRQEEIARESQRYSQREQSTELTRAEATAKESRSRLEYAEAARLPREMRESLRGELAQALTEAAGVALRQGDTPLFLRREAELARLQQHQDPFERLTRRIIGGPQGAEEALAPLQMLRGVGLEARDLGAGAGANAGRPYAPTVTVRVELTEGLKAKVVEESSLSSLQLITRIVEGMG